MKKQLFFALLIASSSLKAQQLPTSDEVLGIIRQVNSHWQKNHPLEGADKWPFRPYTNNSPFWDNAAYHTGNMEVCKLLPELQEQYLGYSLQWAEAARWQGAYSNDTAQWAYHYGETPQHVLFGDWQICFQTYADLYMIDPQPERIARARGVMEYEMSTTPTDYWWWADGLYMVMPVMVKLYNITGNEQYLNKLSQYWNYAKELMFDKEDHLFYRDGKYIYPKHKSNNGKKDFWARGDGWVLAGLAKVLADTPLGWKERYSFLDTYLDMAKAVKNSQQSEGYWTRSMLDAEHAPGPETSGTAFFTYGLLWGINNGLLSREEYLPVVMRSWNYLTQTALQPDGSVGFVQPIGERAIPGQTVSQTSTANFGVGAYLLACAEMYRLVQTPTLSIQTIPAGMGWSSTSVNTTIFRNSSLFTHRGTQYIAYYDAEGYLTIGKRNLKKENSFTLQRTQYKGNVSDAHNSISIAVDGKGYLHVSFDHHGSPLHYCRSIAPGSIQLGEMLPMISEDLGTHLIAEERDVTYPEFYPLRGGDLLFAYRSGASGQGNLILNRYDVRKQTWQRIQDILISGEDKRNAYWQLCVDASGTIHLSWVWRETWLVETNHDLCYARSRDNGITWERSDGSRYELPITASNAEYACHIPQGSELINQTSMSTDAQGHPYIATYWRDTESEVPQYRMVWFDGTEWRQQQVSQRRHPFSLKGGGTKMIPIARPRLLVNGNEAFYVVRDAELGSRAGLYYTPNLTKASADASLWQYLPLTSHSLHAWEPTVDMTLWQQTAKGKPGRGQLHLFIQDTYQGDGERKLDRLATPVSVKAVKVSR